MTPMAQPENGGQLPVPAQKVESAEAAKSQAILPPDAEKALEKVIEEGGPKALLSVFAAFSRTSSFGPDAETAKVLAQVEIHAEDSRLHGYQATLNNRNEQNIRDDGFRRKKLNHETCIQIVVLVAALAGIAMGLYLYITDRKDLGGYVLFASFFLLYSAAGGKLAPPKSPS